MRIFQLNDGKIPAYQTCIQQVREARPKNVPVILYSRVSDVPNCSDYRAASNIFRCRLACEHGDMVWMDADVLLDKWFDFEFKKGKVYFGRGANGQPENWFFYVNGRTDFFRDMMKTFKKNKPDDIFWFSRFVKTRLDDVETIPNGYITHLLLSRAIQAGHYFTEIGNERYNLFRDKKKNELLVEVR